jgi:hypothetical protein
MDGGADRGALTLGGVEASVRDFRVRWDQQEELYARAMHSTDINIPAGKGMTWGVLRAGGFSGKNSA